jgi:hypothetical protein
MTREPHLKGRQAGRQTESADTAAFTGTVKKTDSLTFRTRPSMTADIEKAAAAANRSVSEQIEYWLGRAIEWERVLGDLEAFKAHLANSRERLADEERRIVEMNLQHKGWDKMYTRDGPVWFGPGTHNIPQSGFVDSNAPPPAPSLPPLLATAVRAEVQSAVREMLEEAGLLSPKKKAGGTAA